MWIEQQLQRLEAMVSRRTRKDFEHIKKIPILDFLNFNSQGYTRCLWHSEKTASLKYYPKQNLVHCFGCGVTKNVIQIYAELNKITYKEAIKQLST